MSQAAHARLWLLQGGAISCMNTNLAVESSTFTDNAAVRSSRLCAAEPVWASNRLCVSPVIRTLLPAAARGAHLQLEAPITISHPRLGVSLPRMAAGRSTLRCVRLCCMARLGVRCCCAPRTLPLSSLRLLLFLTAHTRSPRPPPWHRSTCVLRRATRTAAPQSHPCAASMNSLSTHQFPQPARSMRASPRVCVR